MVFNTPVIATRVGAFPEIIQEGKNGYLVDYDNKEQLASAIRKIFEAKETIHYTIPEHLRWTSIVNDFTKVILKL